MGPRAHRPDLGRRPDAESFLSLPREPQVLTTGRVPYEDLPPLLHAADILIAPYAVNQATRHVSPLKFYEYLATGKPIVAVPLPSIAEYGHAVELAENPEEFVAACERALKDDPRKHEARLNIAQKHTWNERIEEMSLRITGERPPPRRPTRRPPHPRARARPLLNNPAVGFFRRRRRRRQCVRRGGR